MKKLTSMMLALVLLCLSMSLPSFAAETTTATFEDVEYDDWYYFAVYEAQDLNLFAGTSANRFSPNETMTRGMFVTVLGKMAKINTADYSGQSFTDVKSNAYYASYVNWAYKTELVAGTGNGMFSPNEPVTREQACIILYRYALAYELHMEDIDQVGSPVDFVDIENLSDLSKTAIREMFEATIVSGRGYDEFAPLAGLSRAEAAQLFVTSYYVLYNVTEDIPGDDSARYDWAFFDVTFPGYWHGRATWMGAYHVFGTVHGNFSSLHISRTYDQMDLFSIIAVEDTIRYSGVFMNEYEELLPEYQLLNKIRVYDKDWLVLLYIPTVKWVEQGSYIANLEYYRLEQGMDDVIATLKYIDDVEILE